MTRAQHEATVARAKGGLQNVDRLEKIATSHDPKNPRVSLDDVVNSIDAIHYIHPAEAMPDPNGIPKTDILWTMTICICVLKNGWAVQGNSAPAHPANFNEDVGRQLAYEDCIRQIWRLLGFELRQRLYEADVASGTRT